MVAQVDIAPGIWESFLCVRPPPKLLDMLMGCKLQFYEASKRLLASEIAELIPLTFPVTHVLDQDLFPRVARFPVDRWEAEGRPTWTEASCVGFCIKVCRGDVTNLGAVFEFCSKAITGVPAPPIMHTMVGPSASTSMSLFDTATLEEQIRDEQGRL